MTAKPSHLGAVFPASGIRRMFAMAEEYKDIVNLALGEPNFPTPDHIIASVTKALKDGDTHYTLTAGRIELREAIAEKLASRNQITANPADEIIVTIGAVGAIALALVATVNSGDEVLIPDPAWPDYAGHVMLAGAIPVCVPLRECFNFRMVVEDLEAKLTAKTRALIINTPHSPTGAVLAEPDLKQIAAFVLEHDLMAITDEVYEELMYDGRPHFSIGSIPEMRDKTITISSFSKTYAMTGWRIGYATAPREIVAAMTRIQECTASCPSTASQVAGLAALRGPQDCVAHMRSLYDRNRQTLVKALNQLPGVSCFMPKGAFYAFPRVETLGGNSWSIAERLLRDVQLVAVPGDSFGQNGEGHLRLSLAASVDSIDEAVRRLNRFFAKIDAATP